MTLYNANNPSIIPYFVEINDQPENVAIAMRKIYRCFQSKLPVAENVHIQEKLDGSFEFLHWKIDEERPEEESGYVAGAKGDSGSPIIRELYDDQSRKRHVAIAVFNAAVKGTFVDRETEYSADINKKCRDMLSKLDHEVMEWLGLVINFEKQCDANPETCNNDILFS